MTAHCYIGIAVLVLALAAYIVRRISDARYVRAMEPRWEAASAKLRESIERIERLP